TAAEDDDARQEPRARTLAVNERARRAERPEFLLGHRHRRFGRHARRGLRARGMTGLDLLVGNHAVHRYTQVSIGRPSSILRTARSSTRPAPAGSSLKVSRQPPLSGFGSILISLIVPALAVISALGSVATGVPPAAGKIQSITKRRTGDSPLRVARPRRV